MNWKRWLVVFLMVSAFGWMLFDGSRALIVGDYVTPQTGEYAGQLGPWTILVQAIGIAPRSTLMKVIFVALGIFGLAAVIGYALNKPRSRTAVIAAAISGLWFLPIGTITNLIALILLLTTKR